MESHIDEAEACKCQGQECSAGQGAGSCWSPDILKELANAWIESQSLAGMALIFLGLFILLDPFLGHQAWQVVAAPLLWKCEISQIRLHGFPNGQPMPFNLHESLV